MASSSKGGGGGGGQQQQISVAVAMVPAATGPISVPINGTLTFAATVTGSSNQAVTWSLGAAPGGPSTGLGTIDANGNYTAPATIPQCATPPCQIQAAVTASSQADSSATGQALVNVHITVTIAPATDSIGQVGNRHYTAVVNGAPTTASGQTVQWSVSGVTSGGFDNNNLGIYVAPQLPAGTTTLPATITATSTFDQSWPGTAPMTVLPNDPLGTISSLQTLVSSACPQTSGLANGACYSMTVACDGVDNETAYLKVNPSASSGGTVLFIEGDDGNGLYDNSDSSGYTYGASTVQGVLSGGLNAVQVSFGAPFNPSPAQPNGWLTGPGGVRRLACRYATVSNWIYNNPGAINLNVPASSANAKPFCATGNGGGAGAVAYAASNYGQASNLKMVELTSGPLMAKVDQGCICSQGGTGPSYVKGNCNLGSAPLCYSSGSTTILPAIDAAYTSSGKCTAGAITDDFLFESDSIQFERGPSGSLPLPNTTVYMRFGNNDTSAGTPQGLSWESAVSQQTPIVNCEPSAGFELPNDQQSALDIASDIVAACH